MRDRVLSHLQRLEAESIQIMRETVAEAAAWITSDAVDPPPLLIGHDQHGGAFAPGPTCTSRPMLQPLGVARQFDVDHQ